MAKALKAIDLFCGCGGLTLGLKNAGFKVLAGIDNDKLAIETYKKNHAESKPYLESIKKLSPKKIMEDLKLKAGELDLLAGCPPCQGFSTLRTLNGRKDIVDARNDLIFDFLRFIRVMKPKAIMMENVPALYGDSRLLEFKEALKKLGYEFDYKVRDAQYFGVPQRRRRFVMLAVKGCKNVVLPPPSPEKVFVESVLKGLTPPSKSKDNLHNYKVKRSQKVVDIIKAIPKNGGSRFDLPANLVLKCHKKTNGFKDVYGRMNWKSPAPTMTGGCINPSKGRFLHPQANRAITLREAALLQGFPMDYHFELTEGIYTAAKMIGNAFPPKFAQLQAEQAKKFIMNES